MKQRSLPAPAYLAAAVALLAALVYANSLYNGFAFDDVFIIERNPRVRDLGNLRDIWLTPYWPWSGRELGLYRPAAIFLYAVEWALGGGKAWVFHAANIALHAAATVLVFALLRKLADPVSAFVAAIVFALHPVHTEAVANIVGQAELVAAVAVLSACLIHATRPPGPDVSWPRRLVLIPLFLLALATKESAVVLPGLLVLVDLAQKRVPRTVADAARYADAMLMPLFLLTAAVAAYLIVRFDVMSGSMIGVDAAPAMPYLREEHRILNALRAFPEFLRLLFFPQELSADYLPAVLMPVTEVRPMVVLGAFLLLSLTAVALITPWFPRLGFPAAWFLLTIITVSNLFFPIGVLVAERTLYLPSVAACAALAFAWQAAIPHLDRSRRYVATAAVVGVCALLAARTWIRNPDWRDTPAVYRALVRDHPYAYRAQWVQAVGLRMQGVHDLAEEHFRMALRIYPGDSQLLGDYGEFLLAQGRYPEAVDLLERSDDIHSRVQVTKILLAQGYLATERFEDALRVVGEAEALGISPSSTTPLRAVAYLSLGMEDRAVGAARVALRSGTMSTGMWGHVARILALGGFPAEAHTALQKARTAVTSPESLRLLDEVAAAVRDGCYDTPRGLHAAAPCDPIGPAFELDGAPQNANQLQSAIQNTEAAPPAVSGHQR